MYMMPFDDSAAAAVIGNRTMPIGDELADSNTIDFGYCCMYGCVTQADLRCFDFGASIQRFIQSWPARAAAGTAGSSGIRRSRGRSRGIGSSRCEDRDGHNLLL
jgi:hypothetical protein